MKQRYAVVVLFVLIIASSMVSLTSYKTTEKIERSGCFGSRYSKGVPPTSAGVNGNHPVAVRPTTGDGAVVDGFAMGTLLYVSAQYVFEIVWRIGIAGREFRGCKRLHHKTYPYAAATDGNVVAIALAQTAKDRDM